MVSTSEGMVISLPTFSILPSRMITVQFSIVPPVMVYTVACVNAAVASVAFGICAIPVTVTSRSRIKDAMVKVLVIRGSQKAVQMRWMSFQGTRHDAQDR